MRKSQTVKMNEELRVGLEGFVLRTDMGAVGGDVGTDVEGCGAVVFVEVNAHFPNVTPK